MAKKLRSTMVGALASGEARYIVKQNLDFSQVQSLIDGYIVTVTITKKVN